MQSAMLFLMEGPLGAGPAANMMRGGRGGGFLLGGLMSVLWTVLIVLAVLWVVRNWSKITAYVRRTASSVQASSPVVAFTQTPLEILQTRYAKGEINREEYESIRRDLSSEVSPPEAPAVQA